MEWKNIFFKFKFLNELKDGKGFIQNYYSMNDKIEFEGEYLNGIKWNGKGYDVNGNIIYELNNGSGKAKEYNDIDRLIFEGEYLSGKRKKKRKKYNYNGR